MRRTLLVGGSVLGMLLASCGGDPTADGDALEQFIESNLSFAQEQYTADCPDEIPSSKGSTFSCTLTDKNGNTVEISGEFVDDEFYKLDFEDVPQTPAEG
jgi:hypothetical protein